jgi:hypothetical protein
MEIILNCGDKINIPDGCKAEIKDGVITIEKEFKRGDVIVSKIDEILLVTTYDFDSNLLTSFVNIDAHGNLFNNPYQKWNVSHDWRLATDEEKQLLFDKMKEQGLRWNAEENRVEKIRWRAKKSQSYFFIDKDINSMEEEESGDAIDDILWRKFNYFRTEEDAKKATELVKATLKKFHEENKQDEKDNIQ